MKCAKISTAVTELPTSIKPVLTVSTEARISNMPAGKAKKAQPHEEQIMTIRHNADINIDKK